MRKYEHRKVKNKLIFLFWPSLLMLPAMAASGQQKTEYHYLSGHGKDDAVQWNFFCTEGRNSGKWTKIAVPSNWELQGFGGYDYGKSGKKNRKLHALKEHKEEGLYKREFSVPQNWQGKRIKIIFEGSMTDTEVKINGKLAGPIHQGGFYRFSYDITDLLHSGKNLLEVKVSKVSANPSVETAERAADYWVFGGIYRPVYLEVLPAEYLDWSSVDADADGSFKLDLYLKHIAKADNILARILDKDGKQLGSEMRVAINKDQQKAHVSTTVSGHKLWTAESPNLYHVEVQLRQGEDLVHTFKRRFGFRTFEVRVGDGFYLNGKKIRFKGVNRHCFWPDSGRTLTRELSYADARLIKEMNMNAVRMAHYPPDVHFLEACDELGLYVLDELCTWQEPAYDTPTARRLVAQTVKRDQMHPSILFWCNGNEGGWNNEVNDDYAIYDLQERTVLHPWELFNNVDTDHYYGRGREGFSFIEEKLEGENIYLPTEFLHGLYDGGGGAGLDDFWKLVTRSKLGGGGFLWVFADEGVVRTDQNGEIDTFGSYAPDGVVGPYREKEGSFYTIKQIWSPVQVLNEALPKEGILKLENAYDFRNLDSCSFKWQLVKFATLAEAKSGHSTLSQQTLRGPSVAPGKQGELKLNLPEDWQQSDALYVTAYDQEDKELFTWSWSIQQPSSHLQRTLGKRGKGKLNVEEDGDSLRVSAATFTAEFDRRNGLLRSLNDGHKKLSLSNGPRIAHTPKAPAPAAAQEIRISEEQDHVVLEVIKPGNGLDELTWKIHSNGHLEMKCSYSCNGSYDFHGVSFDYPEQLVTAKRWLGDGPYRVWKNRMKGTKFDVWKADHNDFTPGKSWGYPEFQGYFTNINWLKLSTKEGELTIGVDQPNLFLRLYDPRKGPHKGKNFTSGIDVPGDISFLHAIDAVGTKFFGPSKLGPQGQKNQAGGQYKISLRFFAGELK